MKVKFILLIGILMGWIFIVSGADTPTLNPTTITTASTTTPTTSATTTPATEKIENEQNIGKKISDKLSETDIKASNAVLDTTKKSVTINDGGSLTINQDKTERKFENIRTGNNFVFDSSGSLIMASFSPKIDGWYKIENREFYVPKDATVNYENGKVTISVGNAGEIQKPKLIDQNKDPGVIIRYENPADTLIPLKSETGQTYSVKGKGKIGINFDKQGMYFNEKEFEIDGIPIFNPKQNKIHLDFNGKPSFEYPEAYISLNKQQKKVAFGFNKRGASPVFILKPDSVYSSDIGNERDNLGVLVYSEDGKPAFFYTENTRQNKVPIAKTLGGWVLNENGWSPYFDQKRNALLWKNVPVLKGLEVSKGQLPIEIHAYKIDENGKAVNALKEKDIIVIGNDGRMGVGPDPGFIGIKSDQYRSYSGLYHGVSHWVSYNLPPSEKTFKDFTGVSLIYDPGVSKNPNEIKKIMDILGSADRKVLKSINTINLKTSGYAGLAHSGGLIELNTGQSGYVSAGTLDHELGHTRHFVLGAYGNSEFNSKWSVAGGFNGPHTYSYGYRTKVESVSTFREMVNRNSWGHTDGDVFGSWRDGLNNPSVRARAVLMYQYEQWTKAQLERVFSLANPPLATDDASLKRYLSEGGLRV